MSSSPANQKERFSNKVGWNSSFLTLRNRKQQGGPSNFPKEYKDLRSLLLLLVFCTSTSWPFVSHFSSPHMIYHSAWGSSKPKLKLSASAGTWDLISRTAFQTGLSSDEAFFWCLTLSYRALGFLVLSPLWFLFSDFRRIGLKFCSITINIRSWNVIWSKFQKAPVQALRFGAWNLFYLFFLPHSGSFQKFWLWPKWPSKSYDFYFLYDLA